VEGVAGGNEAGGLRPAAGQQAGEARQPECGLEFMIQVHERIPCQV
jgi:hypothetical protein